MQTNKFWVALLVFLFFCSVHGQTCDSHFTVCTDVNCGNALDLGTNFTVGCGIIRYCSSHDIGARVTECIDGKKTVFYYWKPPATCIPSSELATLPNPVQIDCSTQCHTPGYYFDGTTCKKCAAGSYSTSGKIVVDNWRKWPSPQLTTSCRATSTYNCSNWRINPNGNYIDSGDNTFSRYGDSSLELRVEVVNVPANFSFEYMTTGRVSATPLAVIISGETSRYLQESSTWTTWSTVITHPGFHTVTWRFFKSGIVGSSEAARIRRIDIHGKTTVQTECNTCPAGTFAAEEGSESCKPCPRGTTSSAGATSCAPIVLPPCNTTDYYFVKGQCLNGVQTVSARWFEPKTCDPTQPGSVSLPDDSQLSCQLECKYGQLPMGGDCGYCSADAVYDARAGCMSCSSGTAATERIFYLDRWTAVNPYNISTFCFGDCYTRGWRFADGYVDSGKNGQDTDSYLRIPIPTRDQQVSELEVSVNYSMSCRDGELDIALNNAHYTVDCGGCQSPLQFHTATLKVPVTSGMDFVQLRLRYRKRDAPTNDYFHCDRVVVTSIAIRGSSLGSALNCSGCGAGAFLLNSLCLACPAGSFNNVTNQANCKSCPANSFSFKGATECLSCGNGRHSNEGSSKCEWNGETCSFAADIGGVSRKLSWYNVSTSLAARPFYARNDPETMFFFSLCQESWSSLGGAMITSRKGWGQPLVSAGDTVNFRPLSTAMGLEAILETTRNPDCPRAITNMSLVCLADQRQSTQVEIDIVNSCYTTVRIADRSLCPVCTEEDYSEMRGDCINGQQRIVYQRKVGFANTCFGGVTSRPPVTIACSASIQAPYWVIGLVAAIVLAVVVVISGIATFLYFKYRRLQGDFQRLREEHDASDQQNQQL